MLQEIKTKTSKKKSKKASSSILHPAGQAIITKGQ